MSSFKKKEVDSQYSLILENIEGAISSMSYSDLVSRPSNAKRSNPSISNAVTEEFSIAMAKLTQIEFLEDTLQNFKSEKYIKFSYVVKVGGIVCPIIFFTGNENYLGSKLIYFKKAINDLAVSDRYEVHPILITLTENLRAIGKLDGSALTFEKTKNFLKVFEKELSLSLCLYGINIVS
jgi:hypothetical protein